jgi:erythrin-vacuolar iron transport family protein
MISKEPCGDHPHTGPPAQAPGPAIVSAAADAARHDRPDRRIAVHPGTCFAFLAGLATALGAGVSMAFSEGLSDTGDLTGRGNPYLRGKITGTGTFLGGILHTLPFLIPAYRAALAVALAVIVFELVALAWIRWRFFATGFLRSFISIAIGGAIIASVSAALGAVS